MIKTPIGVFFIVWSIASMYSYLVVGMFDYMLAAGVGALIAYVIAKWIVRWVSGYVWEEREGD